MAKKKYVPPQLIEYGDLSRLLGLAGFDAGDNNIAAVARILRDAPAELRREAATGRFSQSLLEHIRARFGLSTG